jgi:hypothetical protein
MVVSIFAVFFLSSISFFPISAAAGSVIFQTNRTHYSETQRVFIGGLVSPPPKVSGTSVAITILGPNGKTVDANQFVVLANYGTFKGFFVTGGPGYTLSGTYTITANYNGATASVVFSYSA